MKYFDEYIFISADTDYAWQMWNDINKMNNGKLLYSPVNIKNPVLKILHHIHFSYSINMRVSLPYKQIWNKYYSIESYLKENGMSQCIIFCDNSICRMDRKYLEKIKKKHKLYFVLVNVNVYSLKDRILNKYMDLCDQVYTFDSHDAKKYHFYYHPYNYSAVADQSESYEQDVFFVGNAKNRLDEIEMIQKILSNNKLSTKFYVNSVSRKDQHNLDIIYNQWLSYSDVINNILKSKCILEIVDKGQKGYTIRTFEAICYNKHLITNNTNIRKEKFYDEKYIHCFEKVEDVAMITKDLLSSKADFKYNGEFSPICLIDKIENNYKKESEKNEHINTKCWDKE